jgi:hypothetical protein
LSYNFLQPTEEVQMTEAEYLKKTALTMQEMANVRAGLNHFPWLDIKVSVEMNFNGQMTEPLGADKTLANLVTYKRLATNGHEAELPKIKAGLADVFGEEWKEIPISRLYEEHWSALRWGGFQDYSKPTNRLVALNYALLSAGLAALNLHRTYHNR